MAKSTRSRSLFPDPSDQATPSAASKKRPAGDDPEETMVAANKKVKKNGQEAGEKSRVTQTAPFQRVFSKDDEVLLLKAWEERDGSVDMDAFYNSVKEGLSVTVTKSQVQEKLKRLRTSYNKCMANKDYTPKPKQGREEVLTGMDGFLESFKGFGLPETFLLHGMKLVDETKLAQLNARWVKLQVAELELFTDKVDLMSDQAKLILEAFNQSES